MFFAAISGLIAAKPSVSSSRGNRGGTGMIIDRRGMLQLGLATGMLAFSPMAADYVADAKPPALGRVTWMNQIFDQMASRGEENNTLKLGRFRDAYYYLLGPISWRPSPSDGPNLPSLDVPTGFVTDLTSVPRVFWSLLRPDGDYVYAAILHDYLYWTQMVDRATADTILRIGMEDFGISQSVVTSIYEGVRLGGGAAWRSNAQLKQAGEKRILKKYPDSPLMKWTDWKKNASVFV